MSAREISATILAQLGGAGKLGAMVAAKNFAYDKDGALSFHFKGSKSANIAKVELNGKDLYDITFYKANRKMECPVVANFPNVYQEGLRYQFEEFTGLRLGL